MASTAGEQPAGQQPTRALRAALVDWAIVIAIAFVVSLAGASLRACDDPHLDNSAAGDRSAMPL